MDSDASAVMVAPTGAEAGETVSAAVGGAATVTALLADAEPPTLSRTVTVTVKAPVDAYVCDAVGIA